jgi:hypothetical protein
MFCEKRSFITKAEAKMWLKNARGRGSEARQEERFYKCDSCNLFHLTSMSLEEYEAKKLGTVVPPIQFLYEMN